MLLVQQLAGILDNILSQAQTAADVEGITAARNAHQQAIGRTQRHGVKLHAGVFHALVTVGKGFQLAVVRCHHRQHALLMQVLQHRHSQRSAFVRVGAGADFINQHQISCFDLV